MSHCVSPCDARPLAQAHRPRFSRRQVRRIARLVAIFLESADYGVNGDMNDAQWTEKCKTLAKQRHTQHQHNRAAGGAG